MASKYYKLQLPVLTTGTTIDLPSFAGDIRIDNVGDYDVRYTVNGPVDANSIIIPVGQTRQLGQFNPALLELEAIGTDSQIQIEGLLRNAQ